MYARLMHQEREKYEALLEQKDNANNTQQQQIDEKLLQHSQQHNLYRKDCVQARWELIVHRQAVGFIVGNHKYVTEKFPIAEALPEGNANDGDEAATGSDDDNKTKKPKKAFGDQLDWWQRIGRWR